MTGRAKVKDLVADVISGADLPLAWERLSKRGREGVDAILDAMEGKGGATPEGRDPRDLEQDLLCGLGAIAKVNPEPLLTALDHRPRHAFRLIWSLSTSREKAVPAEADRLRERQGSIGALRSCRGP
jgi:hypothetical protein